MAGHGNGRSRFSSIKVASFCCLYQGRSHIVVASQGLHHDDEMYLFCEQTQMESDFGYPMAVGRATTLEGNNNNSSGVGALTLGDLARVRVLSFCFDVVRRSKRRT